MNVHELKPGDIGLVAHQITPYGSNAWSRKTISVDPSTRMIGSGDFEFEGNTYAIDTHVPHGTLVLIVSKHKLQTGRVLSSSIDPSESNLGFFYRIVWGERILFIRQELVLNPYVNEQTP
jgi:hypothetical protein